MKNLVRRFPQLGFPIQHGIKDTPEYKDAVLRGKPVYGENAFRCSGEVSLTTEATPAGSVDILYLEKREDFEYALRALAYRCEPVEIPASVGASTVRGLINWEKIREHRRRYLAAGGQDWPGEFKRFTADKKNYLDTVILLSGGDYSAVPAEALGLAEDEWREKSLTIRKYHELTHFVCRSFYPGNVEAIRDEVIADFIGLTAAFGTYDPALAGRFLGIWEGRFHEGGRLSHYAGESELERAVKTAEELIGRLAERPRRAEESGVFELLEAVAKELMTET